jgi:hypothetical protein
VTSGVGLYNRVHAVLFKEMENTNRQAHFNERSEEFLLAYFRFEIFLTHPSMCRYRGGIWLYKSGAAKKEKVLNI